MLTGGTVGVGGDVGDGAEVGTDSGVDVCIEVNVGAIVVPQDTDPLVRAMIAISMIMVFFTAILLRAVQQLLAGVASIQYTYFGTNTRGNFVRERPITANVEPTHLPRILSTI